jgi:putrescine transport system ATP-binding protein
MTAVSIQGVGKVFGTYTALHDINLDVDRGDFFALLGGSGCGKTTLLRILAGFEDPTVGRVMIDGQDVAGVPPYARPVNMMFQSYALFPHMTVAENIGYGLRFQQGSKAARSARVAEMLDLVQLADFARRRPDQLSGGQRQRVALARALAKAPKILLLDEPLGALDKKLREATQFELTRIQAQTGVTFIFVTHDQEEAISLASRIAVMDRGRIAQVGAPGEIYEHPASRFVAEFIGSINLFPGRVTGQAGDRITIATADLTLTAIGDAKPGKEVLAALRPEKLYLVGHDGPNTISGVIEDRSYLGKDCLYRARLGSGAMILVNIPNADRNTGALARGDNARFRFDPASVIVIEGEGR